jgi:hypothetical protein
MNWAILVLNVIIGIAGSLMTARIASGSATVNLRANIAAEDNRATLAEKGRI